jgi:hypothetical protein
VPIQGSIDLTMVEGQVGAANGLALGDAAYVQLHNPAGQQGGPDTDGDDDAPTRRNKRSPMDPLKPGSSGIPSIWDAEHEALVNPPGTPDGGSFVLLQPTASGLSVQGSGHVATTQGSGVHFGSFGGGGASRTGATRPPR